MSLHSNQYVVSVHAVPVAWSFEMLVHIEQLTCFCMKYVSYVGLAPRKTATKQFIVQAQRAHHSTYHEPSTIEIPNRKEITFAF
jgi:hypothetical protein